MPEITEVHVTFPSLETATAVCQVLVDEKMAACVNIFPARSIYTWKARLTQEEEYLAILKTLPIWLDTMVSKLKSLHPYEIPAIIWHHMDADPAYRDWIIESLKQ